MSVASVVLFRDGFVLVYAHQIEGKDVLDCSQIGINKCMIIVNDMVY